MDGALDVAADSQFLCADLALYLCPFGDHYGRGAYLSLDVTKNSQAPWPIILPTIERPELIEEAASDCNALPSRAFRMALILFIAALNDRGFSSLSVAPLSRQSIQDRCPEQCQQDGWCQHG